MGNPQTQNAVVPAVDANAAALAELTALRAENERLKAKVASRSTISFKVGDKGGVSAYGLGRFPVTLYKSQWEKLITAIPDLQAFIVTNNAILKEKD